MGGWTGRRVWTSNWEPGSTSQQLFQTEGRCPSPHNSQGVVGQGSVDDIQTRAFSRAGDAPALQRQQAVPRQGPSQGLTPGAELGQEQPAPAARPHLQPGGPQRLGLETAACRYKAQNHKARLTGVVRPEEMEQNCWLPEQEGTFQMSWVRVFGPRSVTH